MNLTETPLARAYLYQGAIVNLRLDTALLPNGETAKREVVEHPGGVCIAALTDRDELLFVRQFRYPYMESILELPAGKRDREGEDAHACARRELLEETGATARELLPLGKLYPSPGYCNEVIHLFVARGLSFGDMHPDADEFLELERIPFEQAVDLALTGELTDAKTIAAVLKLYAYRQRKGAAE